MRAIALALVFVAAALGPAVVHGALIGSSSGGTVYDVNPATGAASNARAIAPAPVAVVGLTANAAGQVYMLSYTAGTVNSSALSTLNPVTGAQTIIGMTGISALYEGDLDFNPLTGLLYAIQDTPVFGTSRIWRLNPATGAGISFVTLSGTSVYDPSAMAFSPSGTLYILDSGFAGSERAVASRLFTVNVATGAVTNSVTLSSDVGIVGGMDFNPANGLLYLLDGEIGSTDSLHTINPSNGVLTSIGFSTPGGFAAMTFIPEPSGAMALAMIVLPLMRRRRRGASAG